MTAARLTSKNGFIIPPAGGIIQIQYAQKTDTGSITLPVGTPIAFTDLSVNITPTSTSSIIKLEAMLCGEFGDADNAWNSVSTFLRDDVNVITQVGSRTCGVGHFASPYHADNNANTPEWSYYTYFDTPNTTSQVTYKAAIEAGWINNDTFHINRTKDDTNASNYERLTSFITVTEIAG